MARWASCGAMGSEPPEIGEARPLSMNWRHGTSGKMPANSPPGGPHSAATLTAVPGTYRSSRLAVSTGRSIAHGSAIDRMPCEPAPLRGLSTAGYGKSTGN